MATSPMMAPMGGGMEPPMEEAMEEEGKSVTITAQPDGTFMVDDQPAASIDEALELARQLLQDEGSADAQVMAGYNKNAPAPGKPSVGKVFGE